MLSFPPFPSPVCNDTPEKLMWMQVPAWENLWNPSCEFYSKKTNSSSHRYHLLRAYHTLNFTFGSDRGRSRQTPMTSGPCHQHFCCWFGDIGHVSLLRQYNPSLPQCLLCYFFHKVIKTTCCQSWLSSGSERLRSINNNLNLNHAIVNDKKILTSHFILVVPLPCIRIYPGKLQYFENRFVYSVGWEGWKALQYYSPAPAQRLPSFSAILATESLSSAADALQEPSLES